MHYLGKAISSGTACQGVTGSVPKKITSRYKNLDGKDGFICLKSIYFTDTPSANYVLKPSCFTHYNAEGENQEFYTKDKTLASGQGFPTPEGSFTEHYIVLYNNKYYDPSYGSELTNYSDENNTTESLYEQKYIVGYLIKGNVYDPEGIIIEKNALIGKKNKEKREINIGTEDPKYYNYENNECKLPD